MNIFNFNLLNDTPDNDLGGFQSTFPLFNPEALKNITFEPITLNFVPPQNISESAEEVPLKKVRINETTELVLKKRGRKAIPKNAKQWDDPEITLKEIIENDLAGEPTQAEVRMNQDRLQKMRDTKAKKRAAKKGLPVQDTQTQAMVVPKQIAVAQPLFQTSQVIFRDGRLVVETPQIQGQTLAPQLVESKKPAKLTSMSFRTKNHTPKWTDEETRKFYKSLEIFGADFSLIAKLFPTRNRAQLKNKFNKEEKTNAKLIDAAFKRNAVLGKRSIMERIRNFDRILEAPEGEIEATQLQRNFSNVSTDSMDNKILDEIQEIFVKEIRPKNMLIAPFGTFGVTAQEPRQLPDVDSFFEFEKTQNEVNQEVEENTAWSNEQREESVISTRQNLFARFMA